MGKIIEDIKNDVVFTPHYVADLMARLTEINNESIVIDNACGTGRLLQAAENAGASQIIGIEFNRDVYNKLCENFNNAYLYNFDGLEAHPEINYENITACLSNPPYSFKNRGLEFGEFIMSKMKNGKCCILIQDSAGNGKGKEKAKEILKKNTLIASLKMPKNLFAGAASVQTAIYLFDVGIPHDFEKNVKFIDFSNDGYKRSARKGSIEKNIDHANERYDEIVNIILKDSTYLNYYKNEYIEDKITEECDDWNYDKHVVIDTMTTEEDFKKVVSDYLTWKVTQMMRGY